MSENDINKNITNEEAENNIANESVTNTSEAKQVEIATEQAAEIEQTETVEPEKQESVDEQEQESVQKAVTEEPKTENDESSASESASTKTQDLTTAILAALEAAKTTGDARATEMLLQIKSNIDATSSAQTAESVEPAPQEPTIAVPVVKEAPAPKKASRYEEDDDDYDDEYYDDDDYDDEYYDDEYDDEEDDDTKRRGSAVGKTIAGIIIAFILIAVIGITASAVYAFTYPNIFYGVGLGGVDMGGKTLEQLTEELAEEYGNPYSNTKMTVYIMDSVEEISLTDIGFKADTDSVAKRVWNVGRDDTDMIERYFTVMRALKAYVLGTVENFEYNIEYSMNEDMLRDILVGYAAKYDTDGTAPTCIETENGIKIVSGTDSRKMDIENSLLSLKQAFSNMDFGSLIPLTVSVKMPESLDFDQIYNKYYIEPVNAAWGKVEADGTYELIPHVVGRSVDIAYIQDQLSAGVSIVDVEFTYTQPEKTTETMQQQIGEKLFKDVLGSISTGLNPSEENRTTNVRLASEKCDGIILLPGEEFSYNNAVGRRTEAAGFKPGTVYIGGGTAEDIGGGICQVSSAIYAAALKAELEITERDNHKYTVSYVPLGADATVYYGSLDFRFKNNTEYPILMSVKQVESTCDVIIYGTEVRDYTVELESKNEITKKFETIYEETTDRSIVAVGKTKTKQGGHNAATADLYKIRKYNDGREERIFMHTDKYALLNKIVYRGVAAPSESTPTPVPTPTKAPTPTPVPTPPAQNTPVPQSTPTQAPSVPTPTPSAPEPPDWIFT